MLLPIKIICDPRLRKNGTNPVGIQYCFSSYQRTVLVTGITVPIRYWNKKLTRVSKELPGIYGNGDSVNEKQGMLKRKAEDIVSFAIKNNINDPVSFLKKAFSPDFNVATLKNIPLKGNEIPGKKERHNLDLYYQIDEYIKSKEKKVCKDMPRIYRNMKEHLLAFE